MKKNYFLLLAFVLTRALVTTAHDKQPLSQWAIKNAFEQKVFIENKGQFDKKSSSRILYGAAFEGVELYFSANGLMYKHDEFVPMTEREAEAFDRMRGENDEKEGTKKMKPMPRYFSIEWLGSNPNCEVLAEEPVSFYYTYANEDNATAPTIKANAYTRIVYKNLYPNIDLQYIFPSDKSGVKYSFILHPGANPADIKMKYKDAEDIQLDASGNIVAQSAFGEFIDHAPQTFSADNSQAISSAFVVKKNVVSFSLPDISEQGDVIIDPWTTNPVFSGYNAAYDINYDAYGNVYALGSYGPYQIVKFNSAGVIQWVFNAVGFGSCAGLYFYGDFAVDEVSGSSYLVEGVGNCSPSSGSRVFKINTLGVQTGTFPGNAAFNEMWRVEYNRCINKIVIAGGTTSGTNQAAMLDTNMVNITPVNVLSASGICYDMTMLAIDNNSNFCYMAASISVCGSSTYDSHMIKCPIPNLVPLGFSVPNGSKLKELNSITYTSHAYVGQYPGNGINGMTVSSNWLYTYDSDSLKRWNKNTGALSAAFDASPYAPVYGANGGNAIQVRWGGLSVDACDNLYIGMATTIKQYDASFTLVNTFVLPDTVYDVKLGPNNKLYACGKSFVTQIDLPPSSLGLSFTQAPASCNACDGTATVNLSCGGSSSGFSYSWSTTPVQTTQTATGLCQGIYTVTVGTSCSSTFTGTVSVNGGGVAVTPTITNVSCPGGSDGAISITPNGTVVATYTWSTGSNSNSISGISAGVYTVAVDGGGGCTSTLSFTVTEPAPISYTGTGKEKCNGDTTSATIIPSGGTAGYTVNWTSPVVHTGATIHGVAAGTYSGTITDANGCAQTFSYTVTQPTVLTGSISSSYSCNVPSSGTITVNASGGTLPYTYTWPGFSGNNQNTLNNVPAGIYTVTVKDSNNCAKTFVDTLAYGVAVTPSVINVSCFGGSDGSISLTPSGTVVPTYTWSNSSNASGISGLSAGVYTVLVTGGGCTAPHTYTVTQPSALTYTGTGKPKCYGDTASASIVVAGGTASYTVNWTNPAVHTGATIHGVAAGTYSGTITDANNCQASFTYIITQPPALTGTTGSNYNCNVASSGSITVNVTGGILPYTYNWPGHPGNNQNTLNNVGPGIYTVTVSDSNNCTKTFIDSIISYAPLSLNVASANPCNGGTNGSASATATGGVPGFPIQYSWTGASGSSSSITNLGPGTYTITVTSAACIKTQTVVLVEDPMTDSLEILARYCTGDAAVVLTAPTGAGIQNPYQWYEGSASIANANTSSYTGSVANLPTYSVTWYHNGCKYVSTALLIDVIPSIGQLKPTNIFSPNGDGLNEIYFPFENIPANITGYVENYSFILYNRWGKKVFESSDITHGWDGKMENGNPGDEGVYYWIVTLKSTCANSTEGTFKGFVHLQR